MNKEESAVEVKWERWLKKRIFVREVSGKYEEVYHRLLEQPRVYKSKAFPFKEGPTFFHKSVITPQEVSIAQSIESHIDVLAPGAYGQKHGHMNSAVFYVLNGKGYDIHDNFRYDWEAGDACIVENACVHQHLNADPNHETRVLVFKAKPLFQFFHLLFQKNVNYPAPEPQKGWENFAPED